MKFGKEFASQMVPEWREAYMNYNYLKTLLKQILIFHQRQTTSPEIQMNSRPVPPSKAASLRRRVSLFRAFSGLTSRYGNNSPRKDKEDEVILVSAMQTPDEEQGNDGDQSYQTIFLRSSEDGGDLELMFFRGLDHQFNKVIHFYKTKVEEVVTQAEELSNQMDALIALRIEVTNPTAAAAIAAATAGSPFINRTNTGSISMEVIHEDEQPKRTEVAKGYMMASLEVLSHVKINAAPETPLSTIKNVFKALSLDLNFNKSEVKVAEEKLKQAFIEFHQKLRFLKNYAFLNQLAFSKIMKKYDKFYKSKVEEVVKQAGELSSQMDALIALRIKVTNPIAAAAVAAATAVPPFINRTNTGSIPLEVIQEEKQEKRTEAAKGYKMASLEVLNYVKINAAPETPVSTVKNVFKGLNFDLRFNKSEVKVAEEKLKQAFIEFHEKLRFLKNYAFLNQLAFSKIMKKYDKITSRNASHAYMKMVEESYLSQSDEVAKLIDRVEAVFIKHFCNGNRNQGMDTLRPKAKREKHRITFFVGCFFGLSLALVVAIIVSVHTRDLLKSKGRTHYMNTIFPLYSMFGFLVLHILMYAGNVYFWARYRVNYSFIFGFKPRTELGFKEVLLIGFGLSALTLAAAISNLQMELDPQTKSYKTFTELLPLLLLIVVILILVCPFDIFYRANRFFFLLCIWHCICAPLYVVTLPDFFLADQFTSQVQLLRNLQFYVCYYGWGDFKKRNAETCNNSNVYDILFIVIAVIPYWIRLLQCIRRWNDGRDFTQAQNGLKYFLTIVALVTRTIYTQHGGITMKVISASFSGIATIFSTYWDLVMDWGLLSKNSENPWLRDKLILPNKSVYYIAIVLNMILRLAWMQTVMDFRELPFLHKNALTAIFASLEIIRRGIWNFFRIENEHLNNVGKFRAVKSVPLPFNYEDGYKNM